MAAVTIQSYFGFQENKIYHCFHFFTFCLHELMGPDATTLVLSVLSFKPVFHCLLSPSSGGSLVPPHFLPLERYHLYIWGCWYFSHQSWFHLVIHPAWHFAWCALLLLFGRLVMSDSLRPHGLQHARLLCPSPSPGACSNSYPSSQWCHPTIILCCALLLLPSIFSSIRDFSNESALCIRWPKYWCFSISPSNERTIIPYATYLLYDIKQYLNDSSLSSCCKSNKPKFPRVH